MKASRLRPLFSSLLTALAAGCVLSTYDPPGTAPVVPERSRPNIEQETRQETGPRSIAARHILVAFRGGRRASPYVTRSRDEAYALAQELRERILAGEDFAELAREHSDDRGSAREGGDLGEFTRGQMVKPFSDAAFALEPGGVSDVVESEFGFHIIQRTQ